MTSISNAIPGTQNSPFPTATFNGVFQVAGGEQATETAEASVSLNANLNGVQAATGTGELALEFAQAIKGATEVDPATGHREIIAGAGAQLTSTINSLLVENGFSADQASTLSANLATQLAQGGPITLSAAYDNSSQVNQVSISSYTAGGISLASSVAATEQSGAIAIGINLDTGAVNVAVQEQTSATYEAYGNLTTTTAPLSSAINLLSSTVGALTSESGAIGAGKSDFGQLLDSPSKSGAGGAASAFGNSPLSESEVDTFALSATALVAGTLTTPSTGAGESQAPSPDAPTDFSASTPQDGTSSGSSSASSPSDSGSTDGGLQNLISSLNNTRLVSQQELTTLLQSLAKIAAQAQAAAKTAEHKAAAAGNANNGASDVAAPNGIHAGATNDFEIQFGFTQTTSIQLLDQNGYGSTLYKRPDGSLGKITTQPLHESA